jgi:hypothetical protein
VEQLREVQLVVPVGLPDVLPERQRLPQQLQEVLLHQRVERGVSQHKRMPVKTDPQRNQA